MLPSMVIQRKNLSNLKALKWSYTGFKIAFIAFLKNILIQMKEYIILHKSSLPIPSSFLCRQQTVGDRRVGQYINMEI